MAVPTTSRFFRLLLLLVLSLLAIFVEAAPLGHSAGALPSPDLLFLVIAFFAVRRPGTVSVLIVFLLGLLRDLLTDLPVGIGALGLVAATEVLRTLHTALMRNPFSVEMLAIAGTLAGMLLMQWLAVVLTLVQPPPLAVLAQQWALTVAIYPFLALILRWMFRVGWRKPERS